MVSEPGHPRDQRFSPTAEPRKIVGHDPSGEYLYLGLEDPLVINTGVPKVVLPTSESSPSAKQSCARHRTREASSSPSRSTTSLTP